MNSSYQCFDLSTFISEYAKAVQKPVVFIRSWGWNHGSDVDKINTSMQVYKQFLPTDIYLWMHDSEFVFIELENLEEAMEFLKKISQNLNRQLLLKCICTTAYIIQLVKLWIQTNDIF